MSIKYVAALLALCTPMLSSANDDDIAKALRQIDAEQARVFTLQLDKAKRDCDSNARRCEMYKYYLEQVRHRLLKQRDDSKRIDDDNQYGTVPVMPAPARHN